MKTVRGRIVVSVMAQVPDHIFERDMAEIGKEGFVFSEKDVLHDYVCEASPMAFQDHPCGPDEGDILKISCDSEVDEDSLEVTEF